MPEYKNTIKDEGLGNSVGESRRFEFDGLTVEFVVQNDGSSFVRWNTEHDHGILDKEVLWSIAFMIASDDIKEKLIPVKTHESRVFRQMKRVMLNRDMKKGSVIDVPFKFTVPLEVLIKETKGILLPQ